MITFDDIKLTDTKNTVYLPKHLKIVFCEFLHNKCSNVDFETIPIWEIHDRFSYNGEYRKARGSFYRDHKDMFVGSEYENYPRGMWVGMVSYIDTGYLLEKLKLFYGDTKDEEVKDWEKNTEQKLRIIVNAPDKSDYTILGLDSRKFEVTGSYESVVELRKMMDRKHMDQDEIELILSSIAFK